MQTMLAGQGAGSPAGLGVSLAAGFAGQGSQLTREQLDGMGHGHARAPPMDTPFASTGPSTWDREAQHHHSEAGGA